MPGIPDDVQKAMIEIENARKSGNIIDASKMDAAHQQALHLLMAQNGNPFVAAPGPPDPFADAEAEQKRRQGIQPSAGTLGAFGLGPKKK